MTPRLMAALLALPLVGSAVRAADVPFRADYSSAQKEAATSGRPMLVIVGSPGCVWCVKQDRTTFRDGTVARLASTRVVPVKVDATAAPAIARQLGVRAYPTALLVDADGTVLARMEGYASPAQMSAFIRRAK